LDLLPFEPVSVTALLTDLRRRTGQELGADPHAWRDWFVSTHSSDELGRLQVEYAKTSRRIREIERRAAKAASLAYMRSS
jgi:hypothetical protein